MLATGEFGETIVIQMLPMWLRLLVGRLADRYGRRKFFMADMLALTLLSVLQLFTTNLAALLVIRIALGMAIAVEYTVGTALLMEWVPAKRYFRYQTYLLAYWAIGYFAAYLVGTFTTGFCDRTWQVILASSAIVSTLAGLQRSTRVTTLVGL